MNKINIKELQLLKEQHDNAKHSLDAHYAAGKVMVMLDDIINNLEQKK